MKELCRSDPVKKRNERLQDQKLRGKENVQMKELKSDNSYVGAQFKESIQQGPVFVCTCCKRLLYRKSVVHVPGDRYASYGTNKKKISSVRLVLLVATRINASGYVAHVTKP
ncbi:hypothetical protein DPMN_121912 [Dreissena polymorpha]|uniref:Uncharacterized protein n=1 Tax=Dreissena polymorpha TaxID=45954 RepID=A0A9D4GQY9_DREPO|nr:hypothetical protein DPMN_121912 [Dreissena polymorpha]